MYTLRHATEQIITVGVLFGPNRCECPTELIMGAKLRGYIIKPDGVVVSVLNHTWRGVPNCDGVYYLTLTEQDTNIKGVLSLYIHDGVSLGKPIFMQFEVIDKYVYDSKFTNNLLKVLPEPRIE